MLYYEFYEDFIFMFEMVFKKIHFCQWIDDSHCISTYFLLVVWMDFLWGLLMRLKILSFFSWTLNLGKFSRLLRFILNLKNKQDNRKSVEWKIVWWKKTFHPTLLFFMLLFVWTFGGIGVTFLILKLQWTFFKNNSI